MPGSMGQQDITDAAFAEIIDQASGSVTYIGKAETGTLTSAAASVTL